jgi:hypothetical protein
MLPAHRAVSMVIMPLDGGIAAYCKGSAGLVSGH